MRISVFLHHLKEASRQCGRPLPETLRLARGLGISAVECDQAEASDPSLVALLSDSGLCVSSVYGLFEFGEGQEPKAALPFLEAAKRSGSSLAMVIPGFIRDGSKPGEASWDAKAGAMRDAVARVCEMAAPLGLSLTMEDYDDAAAPFATSAQLRYFLDAIPELGCAFDTGNFRYSCEDELEAFGQVSDRIVHLHCKDRSLVAVPGGERKDALDGTGLWPAPVGSGSMAMAAIVDGLLSRGYSGYFCIEHFGAPDYLDYIERSAAWLKSRAGA